MVLDESLHKNIQLIRGVPQGAILGPTLFLLYINDLSDNVICDIAIYADDTTFYSKCEWASDLCSILNWLLNLNLIYETLRSSLLISMLGKLSWFNLTGLITNGSIDVKMDGSVLEEK